MTAASTGPRRAQPQTTDGGRGVKMERGFLPLREKLDSTYAGVHGKGSSPDLKYMQMRLGSGVRNKAIIF